MSDSGALMMGKRERPSLICDEDGDGGGKTKGRFTKIAVYTLNVQDEKSLFNAQQTEARRQPKHGCVRTYSGSDESYV